MDPSRSVTKPPIAIRNKSLHELRELALQTREQDTTTVERRATIYKRSQAVRAYALKRAAGYCEGCGNPAPFTTHAGEPYLEVHHIRQVSDNGLDHPRWVSALCPTCHRRVHHAVDGKDFNEKISDQIAKIEPISVDEVTV